MSQTYLKPSQTSTILEIHLGSQQLPRVLPRQNHVFIVITSAEILPRWLFPRKICIQYTIFNTYFSTKLLFPTKRYHLHVLEKSLYVIQEVKSIIYFRQFIHPLSLCSRGNGTSFPFTLYIIALAKFCDITFFNNFYFVSLSYHLFICRRQRKIRLVTLCKSYLYDFFFPSFFLVYWASFLNNFYFASFFYHLFICQRQRKIRLVTLSKNYLYKFFF